jgi:hypothetical protein
MAIHLHVDNGERSPSAALIGRDRRVTSTIGGRGGGPDRCAAQRRPVGQV